MYDALRNQYQLTCTATQEAVWVSVSGFRRIRRLRGAEHPAVFRVQFDCPGCQGRHESLLSHDRLDYEPLGAEAYVTFTNLLTGTRELVGTELTELAASRIRTGGWPWTFFCHPESTVRPGFPSALRMVAPAHGATRDQRLGVVVRCFTCHRLTVNMVSSSHLDVPWFNDDQIGYLDAVLRDDELTDEESFRHQLNSSAHRLNWLGLDAG
jgi:hypothetical protein